MASRRNGHGDWNGLSEVYTPEQVEAILNGCNIEVAGETGNDFLCFCPYHGNKFTPSFSVSRTEGVFICFNAACSVTGSLLDLVKDTAKLNDFEALRFIGQMKSGNITSLAERRARKRRMEEVKIFPQEVLDRMKKDFWNDSPALEYMRKRGYSDEILYKFNIGWSANKGMVSTPMYDVQGQPVGVIGRSIGDQKQFNNSVGLPTSQMLWNIHNAAKTGSDSVVIVEANFDAMAVAQAGFPSVVACLGGNFSQEHADQLAMNFSRIVIMTDFDDAEKHKYQGCKKCGARGYKYCLGHNPGRALGQTIATEMAKRGRDIRWAAYQEREVFPEGVKDAGDMVREPSKIAQCIDGAVSNYVYNSWKIHY
jgi:DNA primase